MSKFSNRLLMLALLSTFAATTTGSAVAAGKDRGKTNNNAVKTGVVTVTNRGGGPLTITSAPSISRLSGKGDFAIVASGTGTPCTASLVVAPGGGACTIGVQYTPSGKGASTARLTLTDSGAGTTTHEAVIRAD